jgi:hypothetical protein
MTQIRTDSHEEIDELVEYFRNPSIVTTVMRRLINAFFLKLA